MSLFLVCVFLNVLISYGMAIALVEKGKDFPIRRYRILLQKFIHNNIGYKWAEVLFCSTCSSFWLSLLVDICLCVISLCLFGQFYFLWPLSGFVTLGFTWTIIEYLNAIDKEQNINVFVDKGESSINTEENNNTNKDK